MRLVQVKFKADMTRFKFVPFPTHSVCMLPDDLLLLAFSPPEPDSLTAAAVQIGAGVALPIHTAYGTPSCRGVGQAWLLP